jgi:hypothetical protein
LVGPRKPNEVKLKGGDKGGVLQGTKDMVLQPGKSEIDYVPLASWYDMSQPGQYTIHVSAHITNDPKSDVVKSNIITVTVLPAQVNPSEENKPSADEPKPEAPGQK